MKGLGEAYEEWIGEYLRKRRLEREKKWTESVAVGDREFVERIKMNLGVKASEWEIVEEEESYQLKEDKSEYMRFLAGK